MCASGIAFILAVIVLFASVQNKPDNNNGLFMKSRVKERGYNLQANASLA